MRGKQENYLAYWRWCRKKKFKLIFLMFTYSSQVLFCCILVFLFVEQFCSDRLIHFSLVFACSYFSFQILYLCLYLQEQAHKTVLEISLLVPLLIFLLHEGNSQTRFVAKLIKHCRPTHCSKEDVGLIKGGGGSIYHRVSLIFSLKMFGLNPNQ